MTRRRRGFETEELVAAALRADGFPHAETPTRGAAGRDILGTPGLCWEIKARTGFEPGSAMRQAARNADGDVPIVVLRPNGMGETTIDLWPMLVPFGAGRRLLRLAGYGDAGQHAWQEYNALGNTCQFPGCTWTEDEHGSR
jgi:hypothetical protein